MGASIKVPFLFSLPQSELVVGHTVVGSGAAFYVEPTVAGPEKLAVGEPRRGRLVDKALFNTSAVSA